MQVGSSTFRFRAPLSIWKLSNNRKKGAQKAAQTQKTTTTKQELIVYCGECGEMYEEETEEVQKWIACDVMCSNWFHWICVVEPESFLVAIVYSMLLYSNGVYLQLQYISEECIYPLHL